MVIMQKLFLNNYYKHFRAVQKNIKTDRLKSIEKL